LFRPTSGIGTKVISFWQPISEIPMAKKNQQFWIYYSVAWLFYAISLGAVFVAGGDSNAWSVFVNVICNVATPFLLGVAVVKFCQKFPLNQQNSIWFVLIHILFAVSFTFLWCFLTLVNLSVWVLLRDGVWAFNWWGNYALQWQFLSGLMAYLTIASSVYVRQSNENLQIELQRNAELEMRAVKAESAQRQAELSALRAKLNPHFLFNTLHTLMALVRTDAAAAEEAIERFALMLRYVLQSQKDEKTERFDVLFAEEWTFIQNYLELENLRLGERLKVKSEIDPATLDVRLPAFLLQPLVENAVKWAISPRAIGGEIQIKANLEGDFLHVSVKDNGDGAVLENTLNADGFGLRLIREILATRYGDSASLTIETAPNTGFMASLVIPV
jgi:sensor histidine kinase YesM